MLHFDWCLLWGKKQIDTIDYMVLLTGWLAGLDDGMKKDMNFIKLSKTTCHAVILPHILARLWGCL